MQFLFTVILTVSQERCLLQILWFHRPVQDNMISGLSVTSQSVYGISCHLLPYQIHPIVLQRHLFRTLLVGYILFFPPRLRNENGQQFAFCCDLFAKHKVITYTVNYHHHSRYNQTRQKELLTLDPNDLNINSSSVSKQSIYKEITSSSHHLDNFLT